MINLFVSKAIGPQGVEAYNFTNSIIQYFVLFVGLGVTMYENREIALACNRKKKLIMNIVSLVGYFIFVSITKNSIYMRKLQYQVRHFF